MKIQNVNDASFRKYGKIIRNVDCTQLIAEMAKTPAPEDAVTYVPSVPELEALPVFADMRDRVYGGMPVQIGYCNGTNNKLNALEYHRDSEINVACTDLILLIGSEQDMDPETFEYDTANVEAFLVPAGTMIEVYATTLHYAPRTEKDLAGIVCYQSEGFNYVFGITKKGEDNCLVLQRTSKGESATLASMTVDETNPIDLQVKAEGDKYTFSYSTNGKDFQAICEPVSGDILSTNVAGGFTGAMIGLYATTSNDAAAQ